MSWREKAVALYRYICSFWNMFHIPKTYILNGKFGEQCAEVNCMCSAGPAPISGLQLSVLPWRSRPTDWSSSDINIRRTSRNAARKTGDSGLLCQKKWKVSERKQPMWMDEQLDKRKLSYISWRTNEDVQIFSFWTNQMIVQVCWQTLPFYVFLTPQLVLQIQVPGGGWGCVGGTVRTVGDCELVCGTAFTFIDAILSVHWGTSLQVKEKVDKRYWRLDLDLVNSLCWEENRRCSRVDTRAWTVLDDLIDKHTIEWDKCKCCSAMERERGEGGGERHIARGGRRGQCLQLFLIIWSVRCLVRHLFGFSMLEQKRRGSFWIEWRGWLLRIFQILFSFSDLEKVNLGCCRKWERWPLDSPPHSPCTPRGNWASRPSKAHSWSLLRFTEHT